MDGGPSRPVVPWVYAGICLYLSACTFVADPVPCAAAVVFVLAALPIHWVCFVWGPRRRARRSHLPDGGVYGVSPSQYAPVS